MNKLMKIALPVFALLTAAAPQAFADQPGRHPAYLHALTDLRNARANLQRRRSDAEVRWDENRAIGDIDAAIHKIKEAAIDDGKNLDDHPALDAHEPYSGRLHHAMEALKAAHHDIDQEEDNDYARGLKRRALADIDSAMNRTREGLCNAGDRAFCQ